MIELLVSHFNESYVPRIILDFQYPTIYLPNYKTIRGQEKTKICKIYRKKSENRYFVRSLLNNILPLIFNQTVFKNPKM